MALHIGEKISEAVSLMIKKPTMGIIVVSENTVTQSYVARKRRYAQMVGVPFVEKYLPENISQEQLEQEVVNFAKTVDGLVVQLPLPSGIDQERVIQLIPRDKDVDALHPGGANEGVVGPVAAAVVEILRQYQIDLSGRNCVVVGQGRLVGKPVASELQRLGGNVHTVNRNTQQSQLQELLQSADIIVSGAGQPGLIQGHMVRSGVVLIDAGTSSASGAVVGDIDPDCYDMASLVSPTPGGVGPVTVAKLFENLIILFTLAD